MEEKVLAIINLIREHKGMESLNEISINCLLRDDLGFTFFDLAELTVRIEDEFDIDIFEDGIVSTVGDILNKLK